MSAWVGPPPIRRMRKIQIAAMTPIGRSHPKIRSRTSVESIRPENSTWWVSSSRRSGASSTPGMRTTTMSVPGVQPVKRASQSGPGASAPLSGSLRTPRISRSPNETCATRPSRTHSMSRLIGISWACGARSQLCRKTRTMIAAAT